MLGAVFVAVFGAVVVLGAVAVFVAVAVLGTYINTSFCMQNRIRHRCRCHRCDQIFGQMASSLS